MKTLIPASIHFWQELSWKARIVFIAFNLFVILLFIWLVLGIMDEAKARRQG